ncbi:TonB-dependent receptor plug domain-containing protein [Methylobacterium persicinum]
MAAAALGGLARGTPARAEETQLQLDEISVESVRGPSGNVATSQDGAATSGGGGGPSGVTGYTARVSPTATKTNTPLIETPQAVSVVTREQLNDRNVQTFDEALAYVPGATINIAGFDPRFDEVYIRGFPALANSSYRDGLRQIGSGFIFPRYEPYGLEAITILRGPASGLYGQGSPAGIIDATSKRPVFAPFGEVWLQGAATAGRRATSISVAPSRAPTARWPGA